MRLCLLLLCTYAIVQIHAVGEYAKLNKKIVVAAPRAACTANPLQRPCPTTYAAARLTAPYLPDDAPCPCPVDGGPGGGIPGPSGSPAIPNSEGLAYFTEPVIASGFINPVAIAFTDDTNELFVGTRNGIIHYVNLNLPVNTIQPPKIFVDLSAEVGFSGDRGLMDVLTHPSYSMVKQLFVMYTLDDTPNDGNEPNAESAQNQRLIRLADLGGGNHNPAFRLVLFGADDASGVPICFNTHALGAMRFGLDGSLFVTTGEGAHWNFDVGDYGQDSAFTITEGNVRGPSLDTQCVQRFGTAQDIGAFRAQVLYSLSGKVLRIAPDSGDGICEGSATGGGYPVKNPFCDGTSGQSKQSKIWAYGLRNPFRMTVRPNILGFAQSTGAAGPGVVYFGDVGQGGYEEINAVKFGTGMNFGWPCWEGPLPSPSYRDSPYNDGITRTDIYGCPGVEGLCQPINASSIARTPGGNRITCPYMYKNMTTEMPFYYYTRFPENDNAGYFNENGFTGQGFIGSTIAGLAFYTGNIYPPKYKNKLFMLDFSSNWVKVATVSPDDDFEEIMDFRDLLYTQPVNGAKHTLVARPANGDICYVTMNGGEVRCFQYEDRNVPPTVVPSAVDNTGIAPVTIQFRTDGTFDRENDPMVFSWNFGDGSATSSLANPNHTYTTAGVFNVTLTATDKYGNAASTVMQVYTNNRRPKVTITSPVKTYNGRVAYFTNETNVVFQANVVDPGDEASHVYRWEFQLVHFGHVHPDVQSRSDVQFSAIGGALPNEGALERNNLNIVLHVTDGGKLEGTDNIRLTPANWLTLFKENHAPIANFTYDSGVLPLQVGQPVIFDAQASKDPDNDRIDYEWNFGDGLTGTGVLTTHVYDTPGTKTVVLTTSDNWGNVTVFSQQINIAARKAIPPVILPVSGERYNFFQVLFSTIQVGAQIYYTTDGTTPSSASIPASTSYFVPYSPYNNFTIKAIAYVNGLDPSTVVTNTYSILPPPCNQLALEKDCNLKCVNTETPLKNGTLVRIPRNPGFNYAGVLPVQNRRLKYIMKNLMGEYDTSKNETTNVHIWVDGGADAGQAIQAKVSYDFTNDGTWDREEIFTTFACDPFAGEYEQFTFTTLAGPPPRLQTVTGTGYLPFRNGTVQIEIWHALGSGNMTMRNDGPVFVGLTGQDKQFSYVSLPYRDTYVTAPTFCFDRCSGSQVEDECNVCNGPGRTGCDNLCYSVKQNDTCGVCGGPGRTGCDNNCFSTLVNDPCGVCGGSGTCTAPGGSISPCHILGIRGNCATPELVCMASNGAAAFELAIPNPNGQGSQNAIPSNPAKVLTLELKNITGFYDNLQGGGVTNVNYYLDSGLTPGTGIQSAVQYDWTGDGTFDRTEIFYACNPNDLVNYELCSKKATNAIPENLFSVTGDATYQNLVSGTVRLHLWGNFDKIYDTSIRADFNGVETSFIKIPYITAYTIPAAYKCTTVANTVTFAPTTGPATTGEPCWDNRCSSYVPPTRTDDTNPTTVQTVAPSGSTCNPACPATGLCVSYVCRNAVCVPEPLSDTPCQVRDYALDTCYDGVCQNGQCLSQGSVLSCDDVDSDSGSFVVASVVLALISLFLVM